MLVNVFFCLACIRSRGSIALLLLVDGVNAAKHLRGIGVVVNRLIRLLSHWRIVSRKQ